MLIAVFFFPLSLLALSSGGVGGYPANPDPHVQYSDSWFIYHLDLGESQQDAIAVVNNSDETQTVKLYPVDSVPSNQGNFALEAEADPRDDIGAWISLSETLVTLKPGEIKTIPFTITIPKDADVGEHSGGIVIQKAQAGTVEGTGASIVTRVGIRVYETVPGEIIRELELKDFRVERIPNEPNYQITLIVENKSNVSLKPETKVVIEGWGKDKYIKYSRLRGGVIIDLRDLTEFYKGQSLSKDWQLLRGQKVTTHWEWEEPQFGRFRFQAKLTYEDQGEKKTVLTPEIVVWVIPWAELGIIFGIIILIVVSWLLLLRLFFGNRGWKKYTVRKGDQLVAIAKASGVSWGKLSRVNKLNEPLLKEGQEILVPPTFRPSLEASEIKINAKSKKLKPK